MDNPDTEKSNEDTEVSSKKHNTNKSNSNDENVLPNEELDITSPQFNPLLFLYSDNINITKKKPSTNYQNFAALESAYKNDGLMNLCFPKSAKLNNKGIKTESSKALGSSSLKESHNEIISRRFMPHQMPIKASAPERTQHNILTQMSSMKGPLACLYKYQTNHNRIRILIRKENGIRGYIEGKLQLFDRHWNMLLSDSVQIYKRRKIGFGENKTSGTPEDCTEVLKKLGIKLPLQTVKSINRKNVEITEYNDQILIRGDEIALVMSALRNTSNTSTEKALKVQ